MSLELPGALVDVAWLEAHLDDPRLVVVDAGIMDDRNAPFRIPGAGRFDLDGALSDPESALPHTMPSPEQFSAEVQKLGISDASTVVVYDPAGVFSSARAWWMFRAMGFDRVAVLDGGLPAWTSAGLITEPADSGQVAVTDASFTPRPRSGFFVGTDDVVTALADGSATVLDARAHDRFTGAIEESRPGVRTGHIPGSMSVPFASLQQDGRMRSRRELEEMLPVDGPLIMSCGSGVTASVLALAASIAGRDDVTVYDGSWTEWGSRTDLPVARGE